MTATSVVTKKEFYEAIHSISYRNQDVKEAFDFGCTSIEDCYNKATHLFARYYLVKEDDKPIVTVMLQRDGHIIFFISSNVNNKLALIRNLKKLADDTIRDAGAIITKTAHWYTEALRLNKVIGFKVLSIRDIYSFYSYGE